MKTSKSHTEMTAISAGFQTTTRSFPMDCYLTMVAKWTVSEKKITGVSYLPAYLPEDGAPYVLEPSDPLFEQVNHYMRTITAEQKLGTVYRLSEDGREVTLGLV